jgi:hypothetical protein
MPRVFYEDEEDEDDKKHACSNIQVETIIGRDAVKLELKHSLQNGFAEKLAKCCGPLMFANAENLMDELEKCREQTYSSFSYDTSGKRTQFFFTTLKNVEKLKGFMFGAIVVSGGGVGLNMKNAKVLQIDYLCGCSSKCELCGHKYKSGTELIKEAKRIAIKFGATEIQVESVKESVGFYKKLHFKPIVNDNVNEQDLFFYLSTHHRKRSRSRSRSRSNSKSRIRSRSPSKSPKRLIKFPENATEEELQEYYEYMTK